MTCESSLFCQKNVSIAPKFYGKKFSKKIDGDIEVGPGLTKVNSAVPNDPVKAAKTCRE